MQEIRVQFLDWEDPLEEGWTTHSSILAWRNINNFKYADGTTVLVEREKELKTLLTRVKEER